MLVQFQLASALLSLHLSLGKTEARTCPPATEPQQPMAVFDDGTGATLYVAIVVSSAGRSYTRLQKWTGHDWQQVGPLLDGVIAALCAYGGDLYAGGELLFGPGLVNLARWDGHTWQNVGHASNPDGAVESLTDFQGRLYVGGAFTRIGRRPADHFARWNGVSWEGLLSREKAIRASALPGLAAVPASGAAPGAIIYDVKRLSLATKWSWIAAASDGVRQWNGRQWQKIAAVVFGEVRSLAVWHGHLYAAATSEIRHPDALTTVYGQLARFDGQSWQMVPKAPAGPLYALAAGPDGKLYVGGSFSRAGQLGASNIACWDGANWSAVGNGLPGRVNTLVVHEGLLYAGGNFGAGSQLSAAHSSAMRWDGDEWSPLSRPGRREPSGSYSFDMASLLPRRAQTAAPGF